MLAIPDYIARAGIDDTRIRFVWDDTRVSEDFRFVPDPWLARFRSLSVPARVALGIGIYEWIVWRFHGLHRDPLPWQIAEAAWCASVDPARMTYVELDREDWIGPIRGPLWCAATWLLPMVFEGRDIPEELESGESYLLRLCVHVLPDTHAFLRWLEDVVQRLEALFPAQPVDPFEDLFDPPSVKLRHDAVARQVLDVERPIDPQALPPASAMLEEADPGNPLLLTAQEAQVHRLRGPFRSNE